MVQVLPHVNAALNATAAILLLIAYVLIKQQKEKAHKWVMIAAFVTSILFLTCYLIYHAQVGEVGTKRFPVTAGPLMRGTYLSILISHIVLAAAVPFLAIGSLYYGWRDLRASHVQARPLARWRTWIRCNLRRRGK
jgi:uncharacterized membrane protein YozB (DUF420 family)